MLFIYKLLSLNCECFYVSAQASYQQRAGDELMRKVKHTKQWRGRNEQHKQYAIS